MNEQQQDNRIDLVKLCSQETSAYFVADSLIAAIVQAETLDRVTWIIRQGVPVAAIVPSDFVTLRTEAEAEPDISDKLDEILGIIRGEELCARCGQPAQGYARGQDGRRLCLSGTKNCYTLTLYEQARDRLSPELREDLERHHGHTAG